MLPWRRGHLTGKFAAPDCDSDHHYSLAPRANSPKTPSLPTAQHFHGKSIPSSGPPKDFGILPKCHLGRLLDPFLERFWLFP